MNFYLTQKPLSNSAIPIPFETPLGFYLMACGGKETFLAAIERV